MCFVSFSFFCFLHSQSFLGHARSPLRLPSPHVGGVDGLSKGVAANWIRARTVKPGVQLEGALWPWIPLILILLLLFLLALPRPVLTYSYLLVFTPWTSAKVPQL